MRRLFYELLTNPKLYVQWFGGTCYMEYDFRTQEHTIIILNDDVGDFNTDNALYEYGIGLIFDQICREYLAIMKLHYTMEGLVHVKY